jgi:hypothetical protein
MGVQQPANGMLDFRRFLGGWNQIGRRDLLQSDLHFSQFGNDMDIKPDGNG